MKVLTALATMVSGIAITSTATFATDFNHCVELEDRKPVAVEISAPDNYANCFSLNGLAADTEVHFTSMSAANSTHQLSVYQLDATAQGTLIGDYDSMGSVLSQVAVTRSADPIAFAVAPNEAEGSKYLRVQYLQMGTSPQVVIEMHDNNPAG